jgi:asparagine N-glycosylation enzyme membrane subunit Stt3
MILGPVVQKYAFGEYWTGFPYGGDFTDNKTLIMWLVWALALAVIGFKPKKKEGISRVTVLVAALAMTVVYLIPHSMGGSSLDYDKVDQGIDPKEAIGTGAEKK